MNWAYRMRAYSIWTEILKGRHFYEHPVVD